MKTAEEWIHKNVAFRDNWLHLTKQIQLDAMKEGMRRAAAICDDTSWNNATAILFASEQLTERDL